MKTYKKMMVKKITVKVIFKIFKMEVLQSSELLKKHIESSN